MQKQTLSSEADVTSRSQKCKIKYSRRRSGSKFADGMVIEVKGRGHFQGSWYPATIVELLGNNSFLLEYQTLRTQDGTEFLKAEADLAYIRPRPPMIQVVEPFGLFAQVDAWYKDGWWTGHISRIIDDMTYMIYIVNTNKEVEFKQSNLRPQQEWVEGQWIAAPKV